MKLAGRKPVVSSFSSRFLGSLGALGMAALSPVQGACTVTTVTADGGTGDGGTIDTGTPPGSDGGDGAVSSLGFTPSNVDPSKLDLTNVGDIDITGTNCGFNSEMLNTCASIDSSKLKFTVITQANQIRIGVYVMRSLRIEPNASMLIFGNFPIVLIATDSIDILGTLAASASADNAVAGGYRSSMSALPGAGPGGGGGGSNMNAGGGGSYCGIGGMGGAQGAAATTGGMAYGTPQMVPLTGGSQGGGGATTNGGAGGGAIQLVAGNALSIPTGASVSVGGGHGNWSGGGGGSGGSLLIEAKTVTVAGILAANGGGGQSGPGGTGAMDALPNNQPALGSTAYMGGAAGGNGSAGASADGSNGGAGTAMPLFIAGGGGGGAGRIRINTRSGSATLTGATLSPDATTSCLTQGTLAP